MNAVNRVAVLGAGNTGFAVAANLALGGWEVTLFELPGFACALDPIRARRVIRLEGVAGHGEAALSRVTSDPAEALSRNDLLLLTVPSYAHRAFAEACVPHLRPGHVLALLPGNFGSLEFARLLRAAGKDVGADGILLAESDTAPYVCRRTAPDTATVWGVVSGFGVGVLPASSTGKAASLLAPLFPRDGRPNSPTAIRPYPHVLACGLGAMNPVVHPAGVLMNAGRIERARGDFYFYEEGVTPAVCSVIEALDRERLSVAQSFGIDLPPVAEAFHAAGFGPAGDLWAVINGSRMLTALRAPAAVDTRWLTEDVPYGLETWCALGRVAGLDCPAMNSVARLCRLALGREIGPARSLGDLGLSGMNVSEILEQLA